MKRNFGFDRMPLETRLRWEKETHSIVLFDEVKYNNPIIFQKGNDSLLYIAVGEESPSIILMGIQIYQLKNFLNNNF